MECGQSVEGTEDVVQDLDDLLRARPLGEGREVDDIGEEDGHVVVALRDHARLALQSRGDRRWQDVEQEALRLREGHVPGADGELEQEVGGQGDTEDVEHEEGHLEEGRDVRRRGGQAGIDDPREEGQDDEGQEPGHRRARVVEEEGTEDRDQGPEADRARSLVAAEAPLEQERQEQHEHDLAHAEEAVALRPGEGHEARHRGDLIGERDGGRSRQTEGQVRADPDEGQQRDDGGREGQGHLLDPNLLGVGGRHADGGPAADESPDLGGGAPEPVVPGRAGDGSGRVGVGTRRSEHARKGTASRWRPDGQDHGRTAPPMTTLWPSFAPLADGLLDA